MKMQYGSIAIATGKIYSLAINTIGSPAIVIHTYVWIKFTSAIVNSKRITTVYPTMVFQATYFLILTPVIRFRIRFGKKSL